MIELWILVALLSVLFRGFKKPYQKKLLNNHSESIVLFARESFALILFIPIIAYFALTSDLLGTQRSIIAMLGSGVLNIVGSFMSVAALNREDASVVAPIMSFTPIFTALTEPLLTSEQISFVIIAGSILSAVGVAIISTKGDGIIQLEETVNKRAVILALGVNVVYGFASTFDGIATSSINPIFVSFVVISFIWIGTVIRIGVQDELDELKSSFSTIMKKDKGKVGTIQFLVSVTTFITFGLAPSAAQSVIVFQLAPILVVVIGRVWLDEKLFSRRLVGAILISAGVVLAIIA